MRPQVRCLGPGSGQAALSSCHLGSSKRRDREPLGGLPRFPTAAACPSVDGFSKLKAQSGGGGGLEEKEEGGPGSRGAVRSGVARWGLLTASPRLLAQQCSPGWGPGPGPGPARAKGSP